jgi:hypothetical protein
MPSAGSAIGYGLGFVVATVLLLPIDRAQLSLLILH